LSTTKQCQLTEGGGTVNELTQREFLRWLLTLLYSTQLNKMQRKYSRA